MKMEDTVSLRIEDNQNHPIPDFRSRVIFFLVKFILQSLLDLKRL